MCSSHTGKMLSGILSCALYFTYISGYIIWPSPYPNITSSCSLQNSSHQTLLARSGLIEALVPLVGSRNLRLQLPALQCYAALSLENEVIADMMKTGIYF